MHTYRHTFIERCLMCTPPDPNISSLLIVLSVLFYLLNGSSSSNNVVQEGDERSGRAAALPQPDLRHRPPSSRRRRPRYTPRETAMGMCGRTSKCQLAAPLTAWKKMQSHGMLDIRDWEGDKPSNK